jgi:pyridinium-3,5-biscarboxylic acid mononucleotide sulfurtransferase
MSTSPPPSRIDELRAHIRSLQSTLVCFSGGIDSALLLAIATEQLPGHAIGLTAVSPSLPEEDRQDALRIAESLKADLRLVESHELDSPDYAKNGSDRCYHCRVELYAITDKKRRDWGLDTVINGANLDDLADFRPGMEAARSAGIRMPFIELGFTKADIRAAAHAIGLDTWNKPASACLSSRIPYGTMVTEERLRQVGGMETELRRLGFPQVRVRWHERIARIEVPEERIADLVAPELRLRVVELGRNFGFAYTTVDLTGYRQGSHNEVLAGRSLPLAK